MWGQCAFYGPYTVHLKCFLLFLLWKGQEMKIILELTHPSNLGYHIYLVSRISYDDLK